jgi:uncharacterized protein
MKRRNHRWIRWLALAAVSYATVGVLFMIFENKLIFFPVKYPAGDWNPPGLVFEDAWFTADDGTKLHGVLVPHGSARAVMLIAHGNGGNLTYRFDLIRDLHRRGVASMIFDYRGYGRSEGSPTGHGIMADARAARKWLTQRLGLPSEQLVLFGESLGGAVAVRLAAEGGARALIVHNTFNSLTDAGAYHYPWLPVRLLLKTRLDSASAIRDYRGPFLQFHADRDRVVPFDLGRRLFEAANDPKEFVTLRGEDHGDAWSRPFYEGLERFLGKL